MNYSDPHYERLIEEEVCILGKAGGPLFRVLHSPLRTSLSNEDLVTREDFTEDWRDMPLGLEGIAVHRYPDRLLVFATHLCFQRCAYCCRPSIRPATDSTDISDEKIDRIVSYVQSHREIQELILSGGDPLTCSDDILEHALERFSNESDIRFFRLHTRGPVYQPRRVTARLNRILARYDVRVVLHIVHPYEISPETEDVILQFKRAGLSVFNQFPVLRGINDHHDVLELLLRTLAGMGVYTSSMYVPEPVGKAFGYRVSLERVYRMTDSLKDALPSWMSSFDVCLDTPIGKVRRNHIKNYDEGGNTYLFERNLKRFEYRDIPSCEDISTNREFLLYRP